jgi:hypothetical protein
MNLKELDELIAKAREDGAGDDTTVYISNNRRKYMRDIGSVEFQKREGWPQKEWPIVIEEKG